MSQVAGGSKLISSLYRNVFQRTSGTLLAVMIALPFFEQSFKLFTDGIWESRNKGVSNSYIQKYYLVCAN